MPDSPAAIPATTERVAAMLARVVPSFDHLDVLERLSGGASQETYRLELTAGGAPLRLCMRRAPGGLAPEETDTGSPGITRGGSANAGRAGRRYP